MESASQSSWGMESRDKVVLMQEHCAICTREAFQKLVVAGRQAFGLAVKRLVNIAMCHTSLLGFKDQPKQ